ncbi:MAG TPA: hypothetical protein VHM88_25445, partial [Candidatus Acidoferrales bacterium]|nr:hypothetical protein [Candidatus Acidoferrales bacterium]
RPVIHVGQLRAVQRAAYFRPLCRRRVFILDGAKTMRWDLAGIFLKILEEPPESATLILLAPNAYQLLPTIRSRCLQFFLAPLETQQVEELLKQRTKLKTAERKLAAQWAEGSPGAAMRMDVEEAGRMRRDVLAVLERAVEARSYSQLFAETSRLAKNQKESFENTLDLFYSVLTDLLELSCGPKSFALRNPALREDLEGVSKKIDLEWVAQAVEQVDRLHGRLRRNINRQLGLDAVAIALTGSEPEPDRAPR